MTDEVFDLDALAAESEGTPFRFRFGGEEYEMAPADLKWAAVDDGTMTPVQMFQLLLGDEQWQRIVDSDARLTEPMFVALLEQWSNHYGVAPGESRASRRSSGRTAGPSKQTSKRTIK